MAFYVPYLFLGLASKRFSWSLVLHTRKQFVGISNLPRYHSLPVATSAILNLEELLGRVDGDRELLVELFFVFKSSFPANFQRLKDACRQDDSKQVALEGHMLKGMLLNLSAPRAAAAAAALEQLGTKKELTESPQALSDLLFEAEVLILHMDEYTGELTP